MRLHVGHGTYYYIYYRSSPFTGDNMNEEFVDLAESCFATKSSIDTCKANMRNDLMEPRTAGKLVSIT